MTVSEHPDPLTRTGASAAPPMAAATAAWPARLAMRVWRNKTGLQLLFDVSAWVLAGLLAATVMSSGGIVTVELGIALAASVTLQLVLGLLIGVYRSRFHYGSFSEYGGIAIISLVIACALMAVTLGNSPFVLLTVLSAVILMTGSRYVVRWSHQIATRPLHGQRVLVVGAGAAAESLIRQMLSDPDGAYLPVGLIDDDPRKRHLSIHGVRVRGTSEDIAEVVEWLNVAGVIVAIADSEAGFLQTCRDRLQRTGRWLRTIPPLAEMVNRKVEIADIRDLKVEDLIGRSPIRTDLAEIAEAVAGKRVLVTGAGGSIGSELCRQIFSLNPESLVMLDRDETSLHGVELSLFGSALLMSPNTVLADIRDRAALNRIFAEARPQIVFHAAALKHLPMLQRFPEEAWKTNVHGTLNVLDAARAVGVETFVNVSTDKAASPTSELGRSKRIAEQLVSGFAAKSPGTYLSVRFGNVLGSRGSVLLSFQEQIRRGGPITVTDPEVRRYFMTIREACQLVLQAATIGEDGYVMVLDMGEPVRIVDIARSLVAMSNQNTEIVYTGLREGEKLDEELFGDYEGTVVRIHDKISRVEAPVIEPADLPVVMAERDIIDQFCSRNCRPVTTIGHELGAPVDREPGAQKIETETVHLSATAGLVPERVSREPI
jgi:FlaA1/EpsC-like NDP-sugar epimerase